MYHENIATGLTAVGKGSAPARFAVKKSTGKPVISGKGSFHQREPPVLLGKQTFLWRVLSVICGLSREFLCPVLQVFSVLKAVCAHTFMVFICRSHWNFNSQWVKVLRAQLQPGNQERPVLTPVLPLARRPEADAVCPNPKLPHLEMGITALSRASRSEVLTTENNGGRAWTTTKCSFSLGRPVGETGADGRQVNRGVTKS